MAGKATGSKKGTHARRKGALGEQELARLARQAGYPAERIAEYARYCEKRGWDVEIPRGGSRLLLVQCKRNKRIRWVSEAGESMKGSDENDLKWWWLRADGMSQGVICMLDDVAFKLLRKADGYEQDQAGFRTGR
jgi:hypothetical protein